MFESSKVQLNFTLSFSEQQNSLTIHIRDVIRRIFCCCRHLLYSECNIRHFHVNSFNTTLISLIPFSCGKMSQVQVFVFACEWQQQWSMHKFVCHFLPTALGGLFCVQLSSQLVLGRTLKARTAATQKLLTRHHCKIIDHLVHFKSRVPPFE